MERKNPFKMTVFSGVVLILLLLVFFFGRNFARQDLFNSKNTMTLYARTETGEEPEIDFESYFRDRNYDWEEFTCDFGECDLNTSGVYRIPVYYKGELTRCVLMLQVGEGESEGEKAVGSDIRPAQ